MSQGHSELEKRFAHIMQPIRDLTKNWEVDIAGDLKEYLREIEPIRITFDGGSTTMNFAEAALLIQGSACIYSKKVEFLYALVYQTLDILTSKKRLQQAKSIDAEGRDKDADFPQDNAEEFLSLDDIKEAKNIDMKEADLDTNSNVVKLLTRTPLSLMKLTEPDQDIPLVSRKGEVFGKKGDFRMNTSAIHSSGALILDLSFLSRLEDSLQRHPMSTPIDLISVVPALTDIPNTDELPLIPHQEEPDIAGDISLDDVEMGDPLDESMEDLQPRPQEMKRELRTRLIATKSEEKPVVDPWAPMDPHEPIQSSKKPFKKGRCFRIPAALDTLSNKKRKRKSNQKTDTRVMLPLTEFINKAYFSTSSKLPNNPLKKPLFEEFEYLFYTSVFKKQQEIVKKEKEIMAQQGRYEELQEKEAEEEKELEQQPPGTDIGDSDEFNFAGPEPDDDDDDFGNEDHPSDSQLEIISSYEDLVRKHVDNYIASAQQYAQVTELSKRVQQWEDKIMPLLKREEFLDATTHCLECVGVCNGALHLGFRESCKAEKFGFFDIHEYGAVVLDKLEKEHLLKDSDEPVTFAKVIEGREIFHVSRLFLASLQLANNYNVAVSCQDEGDSALDTMALTLLNKKQINEELAEFKPPSIK